MQNQALISLELPSIVDTPTKLCAQIKENLRLASLNLNQLFWQEADIESLLQTRAIWHDEILRLAWDFFELNNESASILAVGGYGLARLHPYSDIDIVILDSSTQDTFFLEKVEKFIAFCWDCGIKLGASVRTSKDCFTQAKDLSVYTSLLSSRFIAGKKQEAQDFITQFMCSEVWSFNDFFVAKIKERTARYERYHNTSFSLEPSIKESPGGLRDIDLFTWFCTKRYQSSDMALLVKHNDITPQDYEHIIKARNYLWKMRFALHLVCKTPTERLYFEHQAILAKHYAKDNPSLNQAISQLMQLYYQSASMVQETTTLLCQHFQEMLDDSSLINQIPMVDFCESNNGFLNIIKPDKVQNGSAIMHLFYIITKYELKGFTSNSIKWINEQLQNSTEHYFDNVESHTFFLRILALPQGVASTLTLMQQKGVLSRYIPAFANISGQMQYDLFHLYTVDAHTLLLVDYLEKIYQTDHFDKFSFASVCKEFTSKDVLYLSALFHDIGKGQGGTHSLIGKEIAHSFCKKINLSQDKITLIGWLVENHLLMSNYAQTKDIYDDKVIQEFVSKVTTQERLSYLYLFTVADMLATNPSLWNDWRASLLQELYLNAMLCLESNSEGPHLKAQSHQKDALSVLQLSGINDTNLIQEIWHNFDENYFILESSANIAWQTNAILQNKHTGLPFTIALREHHNKIGINIFVYAPNKPNLFTAICACLEKAYLNIVQARIHHTKDNYASMSFVALEIADKSQLSILRIKDIYNDLHEVLLPITQGKDYLLSTVSRHIGRALQGLSTQVIVTQHNEQTVLQVQSPDFPGLLARLGEVFMRQHILVHSAIINTLHGQVEDIFYITDKTTGKALSNDAQIAALTEGIKEAISHYRKT